ncbi:hypothetical protein ACFO9Q_20100 [Paenibacillus sp. GCM10023252]|uniref:hypothetical protein n=1 Tax=Paenibacillus sp. GCM10023252 TaxID=3252649 RepID=UPI0036076E0F
MVLRKTGTKTGGLIAVTCLIIGLIFFGIVYLVDNNKAENEIERVVQNLGGQVVSIHKVKLEESPYLDTMESRIGKREQYSNTFYKIKYSKNNNEFIAWYRSVNGIFPIMNHRGEVL